MVSAVLRQDRRHLESLTMQSDHSLLPRSIPITFPSLILLTMESMEMQFIVFVY